LLRVAWLVAAYAVWETAESRPTWSKLVDRAHVSTRTVARWLQELRVRGYLAHIERGSTPATRPMVLAHVEGNRAAVYGLRLPLTDVEAARLGIVSQVEPGAADHALEEKTGTPSWSLGFSQGASLGGLSRARRVVDAARAAAPVWEKTKSKTDALRARIDEGRLRTLVPTTPFEMLVAAAWLQRHAPIFARLTRKAVRAVCRPYWLAGWSNADVIYALDHRPRSYGDQAAGVLIAMPAELVAAPLLWIRSRLTAWRDANGRILYGWRDQRIAERCARDLVSARHGQAGTRLLRRGDIRLTVERVVEHGRQAAADLRSELDAARRITGYPARPPRVLDTARRLVDAPRSVHLGLPHDSDRSADDPRERALAVARDATRQARRRKWTRLPHER
jgi:hypothetical protein